MLDSASAPAQLHALEGGASCSSIRGLEQTSQDSNLSIRMDTQLTLDPYLLRLSMPWRTSDGRSCRSLFRNVLCDRAMETLPSLKGAVCLCAYICMCVCLSMCDICTCSHYFLGLSSDLCLSDSFPVPNYPRRLS